MKDTFEKQVSNSLLRLHWALKMLVVFHASHSKEVKAELDFLKEVAQNPFTYCLTNEGFNENMKSLGLDTPKHFSLFDLNKNAADCVYKIMICVYDYVLYDKKNNGDCNNDVKGYRYNSKDDAVIAMRLLERDSIMLSGGFVFNGVRDLWNFMFNRSK